MDMFDQLANLSDSFAQVGVNGYNAGLETGKSMERDAIRVKLENILTGKHDQKKEYKIYTSADDVLTEVRELIKELEK